MRTVRHVIHKRQQRRERRRRRVSQGRGRAGLSIITGLSLLAALAVIGISIGYANITRDLPSLDLLPILLDAQDGQLRQPTRLYDSTGQRVLLTLENPGAAGWQALPLDDTLLAHLPETLVKATIASVDPTFWENPGYTLETLDPEQNPTIAQKLAADFLLWEEAPTARRAWRERLLAAQIVSRFGREQVMEWYLNSANYGNYVYGADAAARVYFGKTATDLTLAEAALLAAVAEAPALNPHTAPQAALERQKAIIQQMLRLGLISAEETHQASLEILTFRPPVEAVENMAPAFTRLVLEQVAAQYDQDRIARGGLRIFTTLDYDLQVQAACAAAAQQTRLFGESEEADLECQAARLLPTLILEDDQLSIETSANVVILDPATGQVLAMVGEAAPGLDPGRLPGHPPGTLMTPYVYLSAFTRGLSPASLVWDIPASLPPGLADTFNLDGEFHGPVSIRAALTNDYVTPALQVLNQMGHLSIWRTAMQMGFPSLEYLESETAHRLPLGGGEVTLLEAVHAYSAFDNQGVLAGQFMTGGEDNGQAALSPSAVLRIEDLGGGQWLDWRTPQTRPIVSAQLAYLMTHILSDETARWPSLGHPNPLEIGRPAGTKLGRTSDGQDAWTVGYTPQIVVGVWMGSPNDQDGKTISPLAAAGLWHAVMQYASRDTPVLAWETPPGISSMEVCVPSGMLPTPDCPEIVSEIFLPGNEPNQTDTLYRSFEINRETGRLATVFTPPELVIEQVFLVVPPEAEAWAAQAGIPLPPSDYDLIYIPTTISPTAAITSPAMFTYANGEIAINGNAAGEDFAYYRLQVGQGLNPKTWTLIGEDVGMPVSDGQLGVWNTEGLSGLYAIQLLVVDGDQRVETATIQVTIDNQAPEVLILFPEEGQIFYTGLDNQILFQVRASDDFGIARIEYYLDDALIASLTQPPFSTPWLSRIGLHTLRVRVVDLAGNVTEVRVEFEVKR